MADWIEELKRLASLREQGILSDDEFEELKRDLLPNAPAEQGGDAGDAAAGPDIEELRRLSSLHESGILTDDEFEAEKLRLSGNVDNDDDDGDGRESSPVGESEQELVDEDTLVEAPTRAFRSRAFLGVLALALVGVLLGVFVFSGGESQDDNSDLAQDQQVAGSDGDRVKKTSDDAEPQSQEEPSSTSNSNEGGGPVGSDEEGASNLPPAESTPTAVPAPTPTAIPAPTPTPMPTPTPIIGCNLTVETAAYPSYKIRIDYTNGTPDNVWLNIYMSGGGGTGSYGPVEEIRSGANQVIDLSSTANSLVPLNRVYVEASTLGQPTAWAGNPPYICVLEDLPVYVPPQPTPVPTPTPVPLGSTESFTCTASVEGPWLDDGLNWDGINAYFVCTSDYNFLDFSVPLDISEFNWSCSFEVAGISHSCINGNQGAWGTNAGGSTIQLSNQLDFTCGGTCQPDDQVTVSWALSLDSIGVGYPPNTIFTGQAYTAGTR